jgi:hypothetical protein
MKKLSDLSLTPRTRTALADRLRRRLRVLDLKVLTLQRQISGALAAGDAAGVVTLRAALTDALAERARINATLGG